MKKEGILLIVGIVLIIASFITAFTGHAARWTSTGEVYGFKPLYERSDRDFTQVIAIGEALEDLPTVRPGGVIEFEIWPSKDGAQTGMAIYRDQFVRKGGVAGRTGGESSFYMEGSSDYEWKHIALKAGGLQHNQGNFDFCGTSSKCLEGDCNADKGNKCFLGRGITFTVPQSWSEGVYSAIVCESVPSRTTRSTLDPKCSETAGAQFRVKESYKVPQAGFYQGQTSPN